MAGMFYTWGASGCSPYVQMPSVHSDTPMHLGTPNTPISSNNPPYIAKAPLCICMFWGYLHVIGDVGSFCLDNPHVFGCLPMCPTPPTQLCAPLHVYVLGVIACTMGETSHMLEAEGLKNICQAFGVCQFIHWMSIKLHVVPLL